MSYHTSGSFSCEFIEKDKVTFWGRRNEAIHLNAVEKLDRWRRYFMYAAFYSYQRKAFEKLLADKKSRIDAVASNYLKEIMTGVSHCASD